MVVVFIYSPVRREMYWRWGINTQFTWKNTQPKISLNCWARFGDRPIPVIIVIIFFSPAARDKPTKLLLYHLNRFRPWACLEWLFRATPNTLTLQLFYPSFLKERNSFWLIWASVACVPTCHRIKKLRSEEEACSRTESVNAIRHTLNMDCDL